MSEAHDPTIAEDMRTLHHMGYKQELRRGMSAFSNFAISLSIICILAGGITSFHLGFCSVGGAAIGLGWPLVCLFSLMVAATMGQVASAFPTAGGLYHWAAILGNKGWGWVTAWFNLAGLITVLAAINVGTYEFSMRALGTTLGFDPHSLGETGAYLAQSAGVAVITLSQALFNHRGIRLTTRLTDFSGYLILAFATLLTGSLLWHTPDLSLNRLGRLVTFANYSNLGVDPTAPIWPHTESLPWLFMLGFLLPAYTLTGFDASAHTAEETIGAAHSVPRGIVRSVLVSGVFGWVMLCALVLAAPDMDQAAGHAENVFFWITSTVLPRWQLRVLYLGIALAQYLCGLATVTSASRMLFAFARDGGVPGSPALRVINPTFQTPVLAIWVVALFALGFTLYTPVYSTITVVCAIFLYISYVIPTVLGLLSHGRRWQRMGPWQLGRWYRPLAVGSALGCAVLFIVGVQPPNDKALGIIIGAGGILALIWFGGFRHRFQGPPRTPLLTEEAFAAEKTERIDLPHRMD